MVNGALRIIIPRRTFRRKTEGRYGRKAANLGGFVRAACIRDSLRAAIRHRS
jgi:hypothetical protein